MFCVTGRGDRCDVLCDRKGDRCDVLCDRTGG